MRQHSFSTRVVTLEGAVSLTVQQFVSRVASWGRGTEYLTRVLDDVLPGRRTGNALLLIAYSLTSFIKRGGVSPGISGYFAFLSTYIHGFTGSFSIFLFSTVIIINPVSNVGV